MDTELQVSKTLYKPGQLVAWGNFIIIWISITMKISNLLHSSKCNQTPGKQICTAIIDPQTSCK